MIFRPEWLNKIWRPDSYFKNAKRVTFQVTDNWKKYFSIHRTYYVYYKCLTIEIVDDDHPQPLCVAL